MYIYIYIYQATIVWGHPNHVSRRSLDPGPDLQQQLAIGASAEDLGAGSQGGGAGKAMGKTWENGAISWDGMVFHGISNGDLHGFTYIYIYIYVYMYMIL